jgi:hypothetical protein
VDLLEWSRALRWDDVGPLQVDRLYRIPCRCRPTVTILSIEPAGEAEAPIEGPVAGSSELSDAYATARSLLRDAEADAARQRADTDRYVRQRESEAELLVAKARRLLEVAEEKAAGILLAARLDARRHAVEVIDLDRPGGVPAPSRPVVVGANGLDRILASAIGKAVDRAFVDDR